MTKIVQLVNTCRECPNRHYYSAGTYECMKVQPSRLNDDMSIPDWCPLADFQSAAPHTVYRPCEQHKHLPVTLTAIAVAAVPVCPHCTPGVGLPGGGQHG